ncbi:MAG: hypothetical protein C4521_03420 [Actinobacteria bacterium]|nr:MAG: hypothetical protein C4521_03420 [Actinomycetota bacterium]
MATEQPEKERVFDVERSKRETRDAFANRAMIYYYLFDEMRKHFGLEEAKHVFMLAIRRRGRDIGAKYAGAASARDFEAVAETFVAGSPCEGELFEPAVIEVGQDSCTLSMSACPLVEAWREMGLDDEEVALMCTMAAEIDFATFESAGLEVRFDEKIGEGARRCVLTIRDVG